MPTVKSAYQAGKSLRRRVIVSPASAPTTEKAASGALWIKLDSGDVFVQAGPYSSPDWRELAQAE